MTMHCSLDNSVIACPFRDHRSRAEEPRDLEFELDQAAAVHFAAPPSSLQKLVFFATGANVSK